jgi:hypothetical protein
MTPEYKKRLIKLAKELAKEDMPTTTHDVLISKIHHLVGYILALEEIKD